jgi:hypothetical protein
MIVRHLDSDLLLIAQADHAALAARIMASWRADGFRGWPTRGRVLEATRQHDIGWQTEDAAPRIDPETGFPYDAVNAPIEARQGAWPRAIDRLAPDDPYVGALVAHHAWTVYRRFAAAPDWEEFFSHMERRRDALLATQESCLDTFVRDYAIVGMGDRWSLLFCYGWREPNLREGYRAMLLNSAKRQEQLDAGIVDAGRLEITPDPFDGGSVPLDVSAWRIAARRYRSDTDLRDTLACAPIVHLTGTAIGARLEDSRPMATGRANSRSSCSDQKI